MHLLKTVLSKKTVTIVNFLLSKIHKRIVFYLQRLRLSFDTKTQHYTKSMRHSTKAANLHPTIFFIHNTLHPKYLQWVVYNFYIFRGAIHFF